MQRTFRGEFPQKIDNKGRVSIPANFRRVLEACDPDWLPGGSADPKLIIVYGDASRQFLEGYSAESMANVEAKIKAMKSGARKQYMTRFFSTLTWDTTVDSSGRLVLPKRLRDKIGLTDATEAMFAGTLDTFQIWHPDAYDALQAQRDAEALDGFEPGMDPTMMLDMEE
ncbi:MAG: cell division/cell wall cluster transcriptional repressor MraZ [Pseudomonadota bacterium]